MSKPKPDTITVIRTAGPWRKLKNSNEWFRKYSDGTYAASVFPGDVGREWASQTWSQSSFYPTRIEAMKAADAALGAMSEPNPLAARVEELEAQLKALTKTTEGMKPVGQMSQSDIDKWFESMKAKGFFQ